MFSFRISHFLCSLALLSRLLTSIDVQGHPNLPKKGVGAGSPNKKPEVRLAKVDIQCGNNYNTFPMEKGFVSCTNYGEWQYRCKEESCYVGADRKTLASKELYFYECARLGIEELLPRILAVRYKAANRGGAIEIMDTNGQEYSCRWTKTTDPANVRVSCSHCEEHSFLSPIKPRRSEL
ncbi:hypothetical protein PGT21_035239 [Puccinia graminis f. sp. tritici]|uniref:Uncharacterized protein n=1 Tax=Puccinia graminis f. sp. tritici TaxID=56615 RepID=A0A5B0RXM5_PUCGR|nr:hypothetical protein PGT21_035239 [Puccinia graminis f. sp. tritici]KAA1130128.1 hypothetical protein PGTUg99_002038 [Puccinia graminis f. sp. tritici]